VLKELLCSSPRRRNFYHKKEYTFSTLHWHHDTVMDLAFSMEGESGGGPQKPKPTTQNPQKTFQSQRVAAGREKSIELRVCPLTNKLIPRILNMSRKDLK